jgi:tetratricopeptide (TPR) repeat protein
MKWIFLFLSLWLAPIVMTAQNTSQRNTQGTTMVLEGRVINENGLPISGVNIEGNSGRYATTDYRGYFTLPANMGEEVIIRGLGFETIYYRINSTDDLEIRVQESPESKMNVLSYATAMDSAQFYAPKNTNKATDFLIAGLSNNPEKLTDTQQARAYELLGKLYIDNKQYDLAINSYDQAIDYEFSVARAIEKAKALRLNGDLQESITAYTILKNRAQLNNENRLKILKGLATAYTATNQNKLAANNYEEALKIAALDSRTSEITSLQSLLAGVYNQLGQPQKAEQLFNTAITNSQNDGVAATVNVRAATADFYNSNQQYDKEIELRRKNIAQLESMDVISTQKPAAVKVTDSISNTSMKKAISNDLKVAGNLGYMEEIVSVEPVLTKQGETFKIAEALKAQNKIDDAISNFKSSMDEAIANDDVVVKKVAARELFELYRKKGNNDLALKFNDLYLEAVDELYTEKETELAESARRTKELLSKQNRISNLEKDRQLIENKIELINTEKELSEQMNQRQRWIIYSLVALSLLLLTLAYFMYRNNRQQKINNHLLALKSLRSQMNPHFIFNALNSVNSFIALNDERAANKYLTDFSKLMRSVLENSELDFIPLTKEMDLLSLYLKLEHERFKDKFDYQITIAPAVNDLKIEVPPMLLQPIIENAVWHGLRYKKEKGFLEVTINASGKNGIEVRIIDNGIGRAQSQTLKTEHQKKRDSKGLGNIKNRIALLNELHEYKIQLHVDDAGLLPDVGTKVVVVMEDLRVEK